MKGSKTTILICCGESSGDLHASALIEKLKIEIPDVRILALGGDKSRGAGAELLFHIDDYSVIGFSEVIAKLPRFIRLERAMKSALREGVDLFIAVDYPGLNLRLASFAKRLNIPVLYYISPQVWAWGASRIGKIEQVVDYMALILPFEKGIYKNIESEFIGHPFVEDHPFPGAIPWEKRTGIGLLPGSRMQEIKRILPVMLSAAERISPREGCQISLSAAPGIPENLYKDITEGFNIDLKIVYDAVGLMRASRLLLVASGTATLQAALLETPLLIIYRVSWLNYLLAKRMIRLRNIGLVNLVLGFEVCPEFIQNEAEPDRIAEAALNLLEKNHPRIKMQTEMAKLRALLKGEGGCRRVAEAASRLIERKRAGIKISPQVRHEIQ